MRTAEQIFDESDLLFHAKTIDQFDCLIRTIQQAQIEAWNEALRTVQYKYETDKSFNVKTITDLLK